LRAEGAPESLSAFFCGLNPSFFFTVSAVQLPCAAEK
jgi:hypothetical protein